ncbi:MAG: hypothetical protein VB078_00565 [Clostridiaceae bacterium]|nr:hypothetical protein [Clostridiaceae bacterium]
MLVLLMGFVLIAVIDLVPLIIKKSKNGVPVFLLIFIPTLVLSIMLKLNIKIPSIMIWLGDVLKKIGISY